MKNESLVIRAFRGEKTERIPVWMMRQAGRYLPEYQEIRQKHRLLQMMQTPELAAEITLQPLRRYELDAAIIFADILTPLIGMGLTLDFVEGEGPRFDRKITSLSDVEALRVPTAEENVGYTLKAITLVAQELAAKNKPVLGFSGSPFTLAYYLIEGGGEKGLHQTKAFAFSEPKAWSLLCDKLSSLIVEYLIAQVKAGVSAVQLFDPLAGYLSPREYREWVFPWVKKIIEEVKKETNAPLLYFVTWGAFGLYPTISKLPCDGVSVDWRGTLTQAAHLLPGKALQGNLDPSLLFAPLPFLEAEVQEILSQVTALESGYVFNLGHGILPKTPLSSVQRVIELVHNSISHLS